MNVVLLMMGGKGTRLGSKIPKQYIKVNNIPIFIYILNKYEKMKEIDKIVIVSNDQYIDFVNKWITTLNITKVCNVCPGGNGRNMDIKTGLNEIRKINQNCNVLIHDATHPYVDEPGTKKLIDAINEYGAATLVECNYDTVYKIENDIIKEVLDRNKIVSGASPEGFKFELIDDIYNHATEEEFNKFTSAGAMIINNGIKMKTIETDLLNLKITFKRDLDLFIKLINCYYFKDDEND